MVVHSSKLVPYEEPEVDPQEIYIEEFEDETPQEEETIMQDIPTEHKDLMEEPHADPEPRPPKRKWGRKWKQTMTQCSILFTQYYRCTAKKKKKKTGMNKVNDKEMEGYCAREITVALNCEGIDNIINDKVNHIWLIEERLT